jgi:predicted  nucleic acid-binding Zn-ribbon protein
MSRLELAAERLGNALETLDRATAPLAKARDSASDAERRAKQLSEERETLLARIAELEEELHSLSGLTEEVEDRLDGAIAEIRTSLGR